MSLIKRLLAPVIDLKQIRLGLCAYKNYIHDWRAYSNMAHAEPLFLKDAYPCLHDRTPVTPYDSHYFYQDIWAFKAIQRSGTSSHVDVGSRTIYVGMLSTITHVTFIDIRRLAVNLDDFDLREGSILDLPLDDDTVSSLSCLHVAEHIGLGRYGDILDPEGTKKATFELIRILTSGGNLYFSLPIGKPRVCLMPIVFIRHRRYWSILAI